MANILAIIETILTWIQSSAGATIIQIILEIIAYLKGKADMDAVAKEVLAHVQKLTKASVQA